MLGKTVKMLKQVLKYIPLENVAVHYHDTYGQALSNILASLQVCILLLYYVPLTKHPIIAWGERCGLLCGRIRRYISYYALFETLSWYLQRRLSPLKGVHTQRGRREMWRQRM